MNQSLEYELEYKFETQLDVDKFMHRCDMQKKQLAGITVFVHHAEPRIIIKSIEKHKFNMACAVATELGALPILVQGS